VFEWKGEGGEGESLRRCKVWKSWIFFLFFFWIGEYYKFILSQKKKKGINGRKNVKDWSKAEKINNK